MFYSILKEIFFSYLRYRGKLIPRSSCGVVGSEYFPKCKVIKCERFDHSMFILPVHEAWAALFLALVLLTVPSSDN